MIRRLLHAHGDLLMNAVFCAVAIGFVLLGYGEVQQRDEQAQSTLTACEGCGKTAVAAKD
ncbi:hypothetical protein [Achromobacter mucicolens]|uniref:hypothetical protein n=1 Tax=Achromobacter mucicolens TaxID=1389922 RepID=UPI0022F3E756|nr:hypothetical protein [Achromobacter mucicolens]WBX91598.1 hypothetical protein PE062_13450 [Achromobacter mucicolens]